MKMLMNLVAALAVGAAAALTQGCAGNKPQEGSASTMDKSVQQAMTPDQAKARLAEGNRRYLAGAELHRNYESQRHATAEHQYPFAVVLACIDSRAAPEIVFDQGIGDLFVPRVAGNYAPVNILGSMEYSTKVAGAKLVVVMGHTHCGAIKGACDNVQLGNLTTVVQAIHPAVEEVTDITVDRTSKNERFVEEVMERNVRITVAKIRRDSPVMREMEDSGQIKIVGAIYDIESGRVTFLN